MKIVLKALFLIQKKCIDLFWVDTFQMGNCISVTMLIFDKTYPAYRNLFFLNKDGVISDISLANVLNSMLDSSMILN